jgi:D-alanyl-D-alanine carboxypeptidase/D-alanyl-D-alanine-endopeptidase (penicillin-binding protein 4)
MRRDAMRGAAALTAVLFGAACTPVASAPTPQRLSPRAQLAHMIDSLVSRPMFRTAEWAVLVVDPARHDTLYAHNPQLLMVPASNMKIVTSAVALTQLGGDFRYLTTFAAHGPVRNGVLQGDLVVTGRGDPTLSDHMRGSAQAAMGELADSIVAHGVRSVTGRLYSGANNFPDAPWGEQWAWDDLVYDYGAGVDELYYNEGMTPTVVHRPQGDTTVQVTSKDPTHDYLLMLQQALQARGVRVAQGVADSVVPRDTVRQDTLFVYRSVPLRDILPALLKPSQNQIAEIFLRTVGLERTGVGTADSGLAVVKRQLTEWGVPRDGYVLHDGSGLSRADLVSNETLVSVLDAMRANPDFPAYYAAMPIAGVDGTIRNRMKGTPAAGNVHAKTGSLGWVRSLSGYVTDANGRQLIFSTLANKWTTPADSVTRTADSIAAALAAFRE